MRAIQGHDIDIVSAERSGTVIDGADASKLMTICHGTQLTNVLSILDQGLIPGFQSQGSRTRNSVHFSPCPPNDERCVSGKRKEGVNAVVHMKRRALMDSKTVSVSGSGALLVNDTVEPELIDAIVHLDRGYERMFFDSRLRKAHSWKMVDMAIGSGRPAVVVPGQPDEPT